MWYELAQVKFHENYACEVIASQRSLLTWYNVTIAIFSTSGGILGWDIFKNLPLISCIVISILSLAKLVQPHFLPTEKQLEKLDKIQNFYCKMYLDLEAIWYAFDGHRITAAEFEQKFYELKNKEVEINPTVNELIKGKNKTLLARAEIKSASYFNKVFNV